MSSVTSPAGPHEQSQKSSRLNACTNFPLGVSIDEYKISLRQEEIPSYKKVVSAKGKPPIKTTKTPGITMIISYNKIINKRMNAKMLQFLKINLLRDT